jgi:hypothetical protein
VEILKTIGKEDIPVSQMVFNQTKFRVSAELEIRRPLLRTLESLKIDVVVCSRRLQVEEALSKSSFDVVFCDERFQMAHIRT